MKSQIFVVAWFAVGVAAIGIGTHFLDAGGDYCPSPSAASVTALFAPCQSFADAMGRSVSSKEAVQMGLLNPDLQSRPDRRLASSRKPDDILR